MSNAERKVKSEVDRAVDDIQQILYRIRAKRGAASGWTRIVWVTGACCFLIGFIAGYTQS